MTSFIQGFLLAISPSCLLAIVVGSIGGVIIGALPGLSSTLGVALLIPFTYGLEPVTAMGLLGGMYCSSIYGGSITAILLNTPGTGAAAATCLDGYPLTQQGHAAKALLTAIYSSFVGGIISTITLMLIAPQLAKIALMFGPPETFMLGVFGLTIIASVSGKDMVKGLLSALIGLLLSTIGFEAVTGYPRFCFGNINLYEGIALVIAIVGFFSIPEALTLVQKGRGNNSFYGKIDLKGDKLTKTEIRHLIPIWIRSAVIGTMIGIIPGVGTPVACFVSYNEAKRSSRHPEKFGTGMIEGVAAPEAANNAVEGGSFVPLLTLGIPGSSQTAVYLGALMILGIQPGPMLFQKQGDLVYAIMLGLILANIVMLLIGRFGIRGFLAIIRMPVEVIIPIIFVFTLVGSFAVSSNIFDVELMFVLGLAGYLMKLNGLPLAPTVLAMILGPIGEEALIQSIQITHGRLLIIFSRPICIVLLVLTIVSLAITFRQNKKTDSVPEKGDKK